jgi:hypothetical protein
MIGFLIAAVVQHLFGSPGPPGNSRRSIMVRLDEQQAADAQLIGDEDTASWWRRRAQIDATQP